MLSACATSPPVERQNAAPATFSDFVSVAEAAAANLEEDFVISGDSARGSDYVVWPDSLARGVVVSYKFGDSPCVTPAIAESAITNAGYVKKSRSMDPHGSRTYETPDANQHAIQENYKRGTGDKKRSLNLDYSVSGGKECVSTMFIDFPR
jgi:hypothetical protein